MSGDSIDDPPIIRRQIFDHTSHDFFRLPGVTIWILREWVERSAAAKDGDNGELDLVAKTKKEIFFFYRFRIAIVCA